MWSWEQIANTVVPVVAAMLTYVYIQPHLNITNTTSDMDIWWQDYETAELRHRPRCRDGEFSLPGMQKCEKWLTCDNITTDVQLKKLLVRGTVKEVHLGKWQNYDIAISELANPLYKDDFRHGLRMLLMFQPSRFVTQLVGFCNNTIITQYHRFGSAENLNNLLMKSHTSKPKKSNNLKLRFRLCKDYVEIINFLHTSPIGIMVMCDSNDLEKTLSQYLLSDDLRLVVNDLDALPEVDNQHNLLIRCGHKQLFGDFVAPEQLWPYEDEEFSDVDMPSYDEKIDIWKIPDVCHYFLNDTTGAESLHFHLFKIHKQCKSNDPQKRPTAKEVLEKYEELYAEL